MKIKDIPINLRPREKASQYGIEKLNDTELLTLIIGSGGKGNSAIDIANELLKSHGMSLENLAKINYVSLTEFLGLKQSIALRLLATFEFHKRLINLSCQKIIRIEGPEDVYLRYKFLEEFEQEVLMILMLDSKMRVIKEKSLYKGTADSFNIDTREIIKEIVMAKAKLFILVHNHPDGESKPSNEDLIATKMVEKSAKTLGIKLVDHIIISKNQFCSVLNDKND